MFALLMILFPTSGAVSCTQQMLKMFLWIMNEFSIHISPWNSHNSSICMFLLPGSHLLIPQNPLTPVCSYSSSNKPAVFCNSISWDQVSSFLGCQAPGLDVFCQRDRGGAGGQVSQGSSLKWSSWARMSHAKLGTTLDRAQSLETSWQLTRIAREAELFWLPRMEVSEWVVWDGREFLTGEYSPGTNRRG